MQRNFLVTWSYFKTVIEVKGYLRYKMITSQNVLFEVQVKKFFYFVEKLCSVLEIFKFCVFNHPLIYEICDVMMNISSTWDRMHFWIYLLSHSSSVTKLSQLTDINKGNNFQESFEQFGGLELSSRSFSI